MRRFRSCSLVIAGLIGAVLFSACDKAGAAGGSAAGASAATTTGAANAVAASPLSASADSLSDSLLIANADRGRLMGRDSGAIWVVMISDFQCPYCKQWHDAAMDSVKRDYVDNGRVRVAYLNLPLQQHKHARAEAEAALCAGVQNQFWPYAAELFKRQQEVAGLPTVQPLLESMARAFKLDMGEFARCQQRQAIRALVESDIQQATKAGVRSTPSFLVGDFLVEGAVPYADFRKAIDTALVLARNAKKSR